MSLLAFPYLPIESSQETSAQSDEVNGSAGYRLSEEDRIKLLQFSLQDVSTLLQLNSPEFWSTLALSNYAIISWLNGYLQYQTERVTATLPFFASHSKTSLLLSSTPEISGFMQRLESKLIRKVFLLGHRIGAELEHPAATAAGVERVVSLSFLMNFSRVFTHMNLNSMSQIWASVMSRDSGKWILDDIGSTTEFFSQTVKSIQKRLEKGVGNGGGKGKGKGKSSAGSGSSGPTTTNEESTAPAIDDRNLNDIRLLADAALSFESVVLLSSTLSRSVSDSIVQSSEFIQALVGCYGIANILSASKTELLAPEDTPNASLEFLDVRSGSKAVVDPKFATELRHLKLSVIALLDTLVTVSYFNPLKVEYKPDFSIERVIQPPVLSCEDGLLPALTESLCDLLLALLESSPIEDPVMFLTSTAPILVDLEVETGVSERLKLVVETVRNLGLGDGHDARLEFVIVSLEQMLAFSGNAMARKDKIEERRQRAAAETEKRGTKAKKTISKNSSKEMQSNTPEMDDEYINRTILISQVHDLFPELGEGFIEACLIALNNDSEQLIMKVLEDNLPEQVLKLDRSMARAAPRATVTQQPNKKTLTRKQKKTKEAAVTESWPSLAPESAGGVLSSRKNVFDNDEFDVFSGTKKVVDSGKIIWGKKDKTESLDAAADQKQAVLALHANALQEEEEYERMKREMDEQRMYDDEYDDTYDSTDIKLAGTVELHMLDESENSVDASRVKRIHADEEDGDKPKKPTGGNSTNAIEQELFSIAGSAGRSVLEKTARKTVARQRLKAKLGWTDEMIEGWFVMYSRNPHQQRRMEEQFAWRGNRAPESVTAAKPRKDDPESSEEEEEENVQENGNPTDGSSQRGRGGHRGGGRGGRGGGRGGSANHSRRNQHAKKMARGMGGPA
ncbi:hypothetical protein BDR26DRAFT_1005755 [Obelidium mucronatum]|nr:hypothetical protein BDR26DRAFT_1005755 [Obelidium mucronatum]